MGIVENLERKLMIILTDLKYGPPQASFSRPLSKSAAYCITNYWEAYWGEIPDAIIRDFCAV